MLITFNTLWEKSRDACHCIDFSIHFLSALPVPEWRKISVGEG